MSTSPENRGRTVERESSSRRKVSVNANRYQRAHNSTATKIHPAKWKSSGQHITDILAEHDALIAENNKLRERVRELEHILAIERSARRTAQSQCEILNHGKNDNDQFTQFIRDVAKIELERREREMNE
jgi:regulator of replication initiation timing